MLLLLLDGLYEVIALLQSHIRNTMFLCYGQYQLLTSSPSLDQLVLVPAMTC